MPGYLPLKRPFKKRMTIAIVRLVEKPKARFVIPTANVVSSMMGRRPYLSDIQPQK